MTFPLQNSLISPHVIFPWPLLFPPLSPFRHFRLSFSGPTVDTERPSGDSTCQRNPKEAKMVREILQFERRHWNSRTMKDLLMPNLRPSGPRDCPRVALSNGQGHFCGNLLISSIKDKRSKENQSFSNVRNSIISPRFVNALSLNVPYFSPLQSLIFHRTEYRLESERDNRDL